MKTFFEYVYYRAAKAYYKQEGGNESVMGLIAVGTIQVFPIIDLGSYWAFKAYGSGYMVSHAKQNAYIAGAFFIFLGVINFFVYKDKYPVYATRWGNESRLRSVLGGSGIILMFIASWVSLILFAEAIRTYDHPAYPKPKPDRTTTFLTYPGN